MIELRDQKVAHLIVLMAGCEAWRSASGNRTGFFARTGKGPRATRGGRLLRRRIEDITASTGAQVTL